MKVSLNWLKAYCDIDEKLAPEAIAELLAHSGFEVEEILRTSCNIQGIVIAKVLSKIKHPNSDRLSICQVYTGDETLQIVCGAPNVEAGQKVALAKIGTVLSPHFKIEKSKIRGEYSYGMICSAAELGLSKESDGIMVLDTDLKEGTDFFNYFKDADTIFDISVTPNRTDCLSHQGVAREFSVLLHLPFRSINSRLKQLPSTFANDMKIEILNDVPCHRFTTQIIRNIHVSSSPENLKNRLEAIGQRSINTLVDLSNYIMFEIGQPVHFYDYDKIKNHYLRIRNANENEKVRTLDDKERSIPSTAIVIEDQEKFAGLAGIMGGLDTEVTNATRTILVEAANWNARSIMKSMKTLNMLSEASYRYSKGVDTELCELAQLYIRQLISEIYPQAEFSNITDFYPDKLEQTVINFEKSFAEKILGHQYDTNTIERIFNGLEIQNIGNNQYIIPSFRQDLSRPIDLVEEIARIDGLNKIPSKKQTTVNYEIQSNKEDEFIDRMKIFLTDYGLQELITGSMVPLSDYSNLNSPLVKIVNPLSDEMDCMRPTLLLSLLQVASHNFNHKQTNLKCFEINRIFYNEHDIAMEERKLAILLSGKRTKKHWSQNEEWIDFYDMKGLVEDLFSFLSLPVPAFKKINSNYYDSEQLSALINDDEILQFGKMSKSLKKQFKLNQDVYLLECDIKLVLKHREATKMHIQEIPKFPKVDRDIAILIDKKITSDDILKCIKKYSGKLLETAEVFDIYQDKQMDSEKHSMAINLIYSAEKTLTDAEIDPLFYGVIEELKAKFQVKLRD